MYLLHDAIKPFNILLCLWCTSSFIKLIVLLYYLECTYEQLKNVAEDEGTLLKSFPNSGKYLDECQKKCKKTEGCRSLTFCPNDKCYLYDKYITKDEPQTVHHDCYTSYKTCKSSKLIHTLQLQNIFT